VYASSVAAYGFHRDNPIGIDEEWPVRPARRLFYAREKAELELRLDGEASRGDGLALYVLRPSIVLGPHAVGGKTIAGAGAGRAVLDLIKKSPLPLPVLVPRMPLQFVHEADVGQALLRCALGQGPAGAYNIAGDGVLTGAELARELGLAPVPIPERIVQAGARAAAALPKLGLPPALDWVEALSHPAIMDTSKAKEKLGWRPEFTGLEALRDTLPG
jgi:nucleoside-diphosphate-sugar epimerase